MILGTIVLKIEKGIELTEKEKDFLRKTPLYVKKICNELNKVQIQELVK